MVKRHAKSTNLLFDAFAVGAAANAATFSVEQDIAETTGFTDNALTFIEGSMGARMEWGGFWIPEDDALDEQAFNQALAASKCWGYWPAGYAAGTWGWELSVRKKMYSVTSPVKGAIAASGSGEGSGYFGRAISVSLGTVAGTSTPASQDMGVAAPAGQSTVSVFRALTVTGTGSATVVLLDSADNSSFASLVTHVGTVTTAGAPLVLFGAASGGRRYVQTQITVTGTLSVTYLHVAYRAFTQTTTT